MTKIYFYVNIKSVFLIIDRSHMFRKLKLCIYALSLATIAPSLQAYLGDSQEANPFAGIEDFESLNHSTSFLAEENQLNSHPFGATQDSTSSTSFAEGDLSYQDPSVLTETPASSISFARETLDHQSFFAYNDSLIASTSAPQNNNNETILGNLDSLFTEEDDQDFNSFFFPNDDEPRRPSFYPSSHSFSSSSSCQTNYKKIQPKTTIVYSTMGQGYSFQYLTGSKRSREETQSDSTSCNASIAPAAKKAKTAENELTEHLIRYFNERQALAGRVIQTAEEQYQAFCSSFPYTLTPCQERAIQEIKEDFGSGKPMYRALVGSVGFGKTEVAIRSAYEVAKAGHQVVILAPLRALAEQHYKTFQKRFKDTGINVAYVEQGYKKKGLLQKIKSGDIQIIIGTHSVFSKEFQYKDIGYIIIDEEHKLGVEQKEALRKNFTNAHVLWMSATLIPRSLALVNAELMKASYLRTPPSGRLPVITRTINFMEADIKQAIDTELDRQGQVFVVVPKIEDIQETLDKLNAFCPGHHIQEVHGRMKKDTINQRLFDFKEKRIDILVSTTLIEVGIDIPNANTIIICNPSTLGMAQLAQLRGRVGRSPVQAYCYVALDTQDPSINRDTLARIDTFVQYSALGDDVKLAEMDLNQRGAGDLTADRQKGSGRGWKQIP